MATRAPITQSARWPAMMRLVTAAEYCDMPKAAFERAVNAGTFPMPVMVGDREWWLREAIDRALASLAGDAGDWRSKVKLYAQKG